MRTRLIIITAVALGIGGLIPLFMVPAEKAPGSEQVIQDDLFDSKNSEDLSLSPPIADKSTFPHPGEPPAISEHTMGLVWLGLGIYALAIFGLVLWKAKYIELGARAAFAVGIIFFHLFALLLVDAIRFTMVAQTGSGQVIKLKLKKSDDSSVYHPVIRFTDPTGHARTFTSGHGSSPASYEKGEKVQVLYDPSNPNNAEVKSIAGWLTIYSYAFVMLLFASMLSIFSGGLTPLKKLFSKNSQG